MSNAIGGWHDWQMVAQSQGRSDLGPSCPAAARQNDLGGHRIGSLNLAGCPWWPWLTSCFWRWASSSWYHTGQQPLQSWKRRPLACAITTSCMVPRLTTAASQPCTVGKETRLSRALIHIKDQATGRRFLVDTGASYSIWPHKSTAPAGQPMQCLDKCLIHQTFQAQVFSWPFILAAGTWGANQCCPYLK
jgi:hypothetical protein